MNEFMRKRQAIEAAIGEAAKTAKEIDRDTHLTAEGKEDKKQAISEKVINSVSEAAEEIQKELQGRQKKVSELQGEIGKVEPAEVANIAAVMSPALASMDYESLLRLYEARSSEPAERALIEQVVQLKIDADADSPQKQTFIEHFGRVSQSIYESLPGYDKLQKAQNEATYLESFNNVLALHLKEWQGQGLNGVERVSLTQNLFTLNQYEQQALT